MLGLPVLTVTVLAVLGRVIYYFYTTFEAWIFNFKGRSMLLERAKKHGDIPFSVQQIGFGGRLHVLSTKQHWNDLSKAEPSDLSGHAWYLHQHEPILSLGTAWPMSRDEEGVPVLRSLRSMNNRLHLLDKEMFEIIETELNRAMESGQALGEWIQVPLVATMERIMAKLSTLVLLGKETSANETFIERGLAYQHEHLIIAEGVRIMPKFFRKLFVRLIKGNDANKIYVHNTLAQLVTTRRRVNKASGSKVTSEPLSSLEALVDYSPAEWTVDEIVRHFNIAWTLASEVASLVSAHFVQDLYSHASCIPRLREEQELVTMDQASRTQKQATLLDSVLIESMRMNSFHSTVSPRIAMRDFTFSDGYTVPAGESVGYHLNRVCHDANIYQRPDVFFPERFLGSNRAVTDVDAEWPFWGAGKVICPGRFFFQKSIRLFTRYMLEHYDCEIQGKKELNFVWRQSAVPRPSTMLLIKRRTVI